MSFKERTRKYLAAVLAVLLLVSLAGCAKTDEQKYARAQNLLTEGKTEAALKAFTEIENYLDSSMYIMYIRAIRMAEEGQYESAVRSFQSLGEFKDSGLMAEYYTARSYESAQMYEEAAEGYNAIVTFRDSGSRLAALSDRILDRDLAAAAALADHALFGSEAQDRALEKLTELADRSYSDDPDRMYGKIAAEADRALEDGAVLYAGALYYMLLGKGAEGALEGCIKTYEAAIGVCMDQGDCNGYDYALGIMEFLSKDPFNRPLKEELVMECSYQIALIDENDGNFAAAYAFYENNLDYKDCAVRAEGLENAYAEAEVLEVTGQYEDAVKAFGALKNYSDSEERAAACNRELDYRKALDLLDEGKTGEAYDAFLKLQGYKDADMLLALESRLVTEAEERAAWSTVGGIVMFGRYEQDKKMDNGPEEIEWLVLEVQEDRVLLISRYALDHKQYSEEYGELTWETSPLRHWLNDDFLNGAFSDEERARISEETVEAHANPYWDTDPGNDTLDRVFLLSTIEAERYFANDEARMAVPTGYAVARGVQIFDPENGEPGVMTCLWWLRTPGDYCTYMTFVGCNGNVIYHGDGVDFEEHAVRPAMWVRTGE